MKALKSLRSASVASVTNFNEWSRKMGVDPLAEMPQVEVDGPFGAPAQVGWLVGCTATIAQRGPCGCIRVQMGGCNQPSQQSETKSIDDIPLPQNYNDYDVVVLVCGGIGITPMASILGNQIKKIKKHMCKTCGEVRVCTLAPIPCGV